MALLPQEDLAASQMNVFQSTFTYSSIGMALVGTKGEWLDVNESLCEIIGYTKADLMSMTFQDITHPDDLEADLALVGQVLASEIKHYEMEKRYFHKNGRIVWVLLTVSLVRNADQSPRFFISQIQDISEKKAFELELMHSRAELKSVLANTQTVIARVNRECRHLYVNAAIENELGRPASAVLGKTFAEMGLHDENTALIEEKVRIVFETKKEQQTEIKNDLLSETRYILLHITPEFNANGEIETVLIVSANITKMKNAEIQLRKALAEIKTLQSILPICSYCRHIRDDSDYWQTVETYIYSNTDTRFSHSICPTCYENVVEPELKRFSNQPR